MFDKRVVRGSTCTGVKNAEIVRAIQEEAERQQKVKPNPNITTLSIAPPFPFALRTLDLPLALSPG